MFYLNQRNIGYIQADKCIKLFHGKIFIKMWFYKCFNFYILYEHDFVSYLYKLLYMK